MNNEDIEKSIPEAPNNELNDNSETEYQSGANGFKNNPSGIIKLDPAADEGLRKLSGDLKSLAKNPLLKSKFPFVDALKILFFVSAVVVATKILMMIMEW